MQGCRHPFPMPPGPRSRSTPLACLQMAWSASKLPSRGRLPLPLHLAGIALMPIVQNSVVTIHYTLKDDAGEVIDTSREGDPIAYLHGHGNLVPGLERELEGKNAGD